MYEYSFYFLLNKGLIRVNTIKDIKEISDKPQGIIVIKGITISILFSLFVQLFEVILSESVKLLDVNLSQSVTFITYIHINEKDYLNEYAMNVRIFSN